MKILYTTDLHGSFKRYKKIIKIHKDYDLTIIGGDILPRELKPAKNFIERYLPIFFSKIETPLLIDFANDDYYCYYEDFKTLVSKFDNIHTFHLKEVIINDISFVGMNNVPDYPFLLKDWCRRDLNKDVFFVKYIKHKPCLSTKNGYKDIESIREYFLSLPSLEDILRNNLPEPINRTVYLMHSPPRHSGLDLCSNYEEVGSLAIRDFICSRAFCEEGNYEIISIHGHIHESPNMSGIYKTSIVPNSISLQPGQSGHINDLKILELNILETSVETNVEYLNWRD